MKNRAHEVQQKNPRLKSEVGVFVAVSPEAVWGVLEKQDCLWRGLREQNLSPDLQIRLKEPHRVLEFCSVQENLEVYGCFRLEKNAGGTQVWLCLEASPLGRAEHWASLLVELSRSVLQELKKTLETRPAYRPVLQSGWLLSCR